MIRSPENRPFHTTFVHVRTRAKERYNLELNIEDVWKIEDCIRKRQNAVYDRRCSSRVTQWIIYLDRIVKNCPVPVIKVRYCHTRRQIVTVVY